MMFPCFTAIPSQLATIDKWAVRKKSQIKIGKRSPKLHEEQVLADHALDKQLMLGKRKTTVKRSQLFCEIKLMVTMMSMVHMVMSKTL